MNKTGDITQRIVSLEWEMFTTVNEGEARASCQDDRVTFMGMRAAQFSAWSEEAAQSYLSDLESAVQEGRNLVAEKYIHMMKTTEPIKHAALLATIPNPDDETQGLAKSVSDKLLEQTRELFETYPYVSGQGRPLYSLYDNVGAVSVETYQLSELLTYSKDTLRALERHIDAQSASGINLAREMLANTVSFYGYASLDTAEAATKERIDKIGIQFTFGCACEACEI